MGTYYDLLPAPEMRSDQAKGAPVYDRTGRRIGRVKWLLINKASGRVSAAHITLGGFMGFGARHHELPWEKMAYDSELDGYKADIKVEQERPVRFGQVPSPRPPAEMAQISVSKEAHADA